MKITIGLRARLYCSLQGPFKDVSWQHISSNTKQWLEIYLSNKARAKLALGSAHCLQGEGWALRWHVRLWRSEEVRKVQLLPRGEEQYQLQAALQRVLRDGWGQLSHPQIAPVDTRNNDIDQGPEANCAAQFSGSKHLHIDVCTCITMATTQYGACPTKSSQICTQLVLWLLWIRMS